MVHDYTLGNSNISKINFLALTKSFDPNLHPRLVQASYNEIICLTLYDLITVINYIMNRFVDHHILWIDHDFASYRYVDKHLSGCKVLVVRLHILVQLFDGFHFYLADIERIARLILIIIEMNILLMSLKHNSFQNRIILLQSSILVSNILVDARLSTHVAKEQLVLLHE